MATELVIIRHGETVWNREGRVQGHADSALTDEGRAQAVACAARLAGDAFDAVYASDLARARETAALLTAGRAAAIRHDARLRERCFGAGEGMTYAELDRHYPELFSRTRETDADFAIEGGESRRAFHARVTAVMAVIAASHAGGRVLVVTHGGVLGALYRHVHGLPIASPHTIEIPNVGYNRLAVEGAAWRLLDWADTSHLPVATAEAS